MHINIYEQLIKKNMSRYELAKRIGVTYPTIDNIFKGNSSSIKFEILESICRELDCTPMDILIPDDPQVKRLYVYQSKLSELTNKSDTK